MLRLMQMLQKPYFLMHYAHFQAFDSMLTSSW